jgi:hypothetical protein
MMPERLSKNKPKFLMTVPFNPKNLSFIHTRIHSKKIKSTDSFKELYSHLNLLNTFNI